jgi:hypothetical protein
MTSARLWLWLVPSAFYLVFCIWYTNLAGPLSDAEIQTFVAKLETAGAPAERISFVRKFMQEDTGRQLIMINALDMNENPPQLPATGPDASAAQLLNHYMAHMYPALLSRASHPVFAGRAVYDAMDVSGIEGAQTWDQGALMRYRSRRDLMEISTDPAFNERHDYKMAALEKTIAYPVEASLYYADMRIMLALILFSLISLADLLAYRR